MKYEREETCQQAVNAGLLDAYHLTTIQEELHPVCPIPPGVLENLMFKGDHNVVGAMNTLCLRDGPQCNHRQIGPEILLVITPRHAEALELIITRHDSTVCIPRFLAYYVKYIDERMGKLRGHALYLSKLFYHNISVDLVQDLEEYPDGDGLPAVIEIDEEEQEYWLHKSVYMVEKQEEIWKILWPRD